MCIFAPKSEETIFSNQTNLPET